MCKKNKFYKGGSFLFLLVIFFFFLPITLVSAQDGVLTGTILDTQDKPLVNANVIGFPLEGQGVKFAISNEQGKYRLLLKKDIPYRIELSYLGYEKRIDTLRLNKNRSLNFVLTPKSETLGEVIIKQEVAVVVKEDTITYRTDAFTNGKENKLKDVLKKLPGIEVDRAGNVKVNGKAVTQLLVEGKPFFTGDEKLGVNNIPADAIDEVVAIDNYNEISFLKGLSDSQDLALNIKLKEGKKKFIFGDVKTGGGIEERYLLHPTLFYYSPKTAINFIGDINNIGEKSFSFRDYLDFEGGIGNLSNGISVKSLLNDDFSQFLNDSDFIFNKSIFGAGSVSQEISSGITLDVYSIINKGDVNKKTESEITYLTGNSILNEQRNEIQEDNLLFSISKIRFRNKKKKNQDLIYDTFVKVTDGVSNLLQNSVTNGQNFFVNTDTKPLSVKLDQNISFNKRISQKSTITINSKYQHFKNRNNKQWRFNQPVFTGNIPFADTDIFRFTQNINKTINNIGLEGKYYYVLNKRNHIYPIVGFTIQDGLYKTDSFQVLNNNSTNSFTQSGFGNDLNLRVFNNFLGVEYKVLIGKKLTLRPQMRYHYYHWFTKQFDTNKISKERSFLLPSLKANIKFSNSKQLRFNTGFKTSLYDISGYADRFVLSNFNRLSIGNRNLDNEVLYDASLSYNSFSFFRGTFFNFNLNYTRNIESVRSSFSVENIDQINRLINTDLPENNYSSFGTFTKKYSKFKFDIGGNFLLSDYSRIINNSKINYKNLLYGFAISAKTRFNKLPNLEAGLRQNFSEFKSDIFVSKFNQSNMFGRLDYAVVEDLRFEMDYSYVIYNDLTFGQTNNFQIGNFIIEYSPENSSFNYSIKGANIFDVRFKNNNSLNQFLIRDNRTFIQPRTVIFSITYKI